MLHYVLNKIYFTQVVERLSENMEKEKYFVSRILIFFDTNLCMVLLIIVAG